VIADSVELVVHADGLDAAVLIAGCDKTLPAMLMAAARLDLSAVLLYGGSIAPGVLPDGKACTIQDVFEAVGAKARGTMDAETFAEIERAACPGAGARGGMFTANTMSAVGEALGMSLPGSASRWALDSSGATVARQAGICGITMPITKHNRLVVDAADIAPAIAEAFHLASTD
jgi:dihydroxy-acid dehydratase